MQALTGLFARQFGTPNYAAHGGFCSVNMAAGMIYTIGGSFWEFGGPDLDRAKLFVMIGTAEDHHSNPLKIAISKFKRAGGRFVSINPVRTGYSAIADEWVPIRPGTDGALLLALIHELIAHGPLRPRVPRALHQRRPAREPRRRRATRFGLLVARRRAPPRSNPHVSAEPAVVGPRAPTGRSRPHAEGADPCLLGEFTLPDGTPVKPAFQLLDERVRDYTPEWAAEITGIPAATIRRLAHEMGVTARDQKIELPIPWTDCWGDGARDGHRQPGRVPRDARARRALERLPDHPRARDPDDRCSAPSTGPGGFRHKAPFPRAIPPQREAAERPGRGASRTRRSAALALGWPASPDDLFVDDDGSAGAHRQGASRGSTRSRCTG